ncbi:hypothetical protein [Paenibacillus cymbidii]|uniref:hypothetical protein n=1 Tax=Paenibacillus cymbidii TaxID=1639034 RepID=UPI00107FF8B7|nr:hypothetical protein [Paenibacillus cymbidii]
MTVVSFIESVKQQLHAEVKAELLAELKAEARYSVSVEMDSASCNSGIDKERLKAELVSEITAEIRSKIATEFKPNLNAYTTIKELVNQRFTRTDLRHAHNPNAVSMFSQMIRDALKVDRMSLLDSDQAERAISMTKEILAVCDKYTVKNEVRNESVNSD